MKMNKLNTILISLIIALIFIVGITCQNSLVQSGNSTDATPTTTIDTTNRGSLRIYIEENIKTRTIITDASAIAFDQYSIELTSDNSFEDRTADFVSNVAVFNNIEAGSWNIAVKAKRAGTVLATGALYHKAITADITTDLTVDIKLIQSATGNVKIRISFPDDSEVDYVEAQLIGDTDYTALSIIDNSPDVDHKMVVFERNNVTSGMIDLLLTFKKGGASGTILGMYREAVNIFDNLTSDKWIDGTTLKSVLLYSATDFASTNSNLFDLTTDSGRAFDAPFTSPDYNYSMKVAYFQDKVRITPTLSILGQSIRYQLNGGGYNYPASGIQSGILFLNVGDNTIDIEVTAQDYAKKNIYSIIVKRLHKPTAPGISITDGSNGGRYTFNPGNNIFYDLTTDYSNRIYHHWTKADTSDPWDPADPLLPDPTTSHNLYYPPSFDEGNRYIWEAPNKTIKWIIKAIAYNEFDETSDVATYRITLDNLKPYNPVLYPGDGSTDVSGNTNLVMTFWETIKKGTGNIYINRYSDDVVIETIDVASAQVTIADKVLTVNPAVDLTEDGTRYYINIDNTAILDIVGNAYSGINVNNGWGFTTKDVVSPTAVFLSLPPTLSNLPWTNITVGGTDVVSYKYKLDGGGYGDETTDGTPIGLAGLSDATHTIYVIGKDAAGNWQTEAGATTYTWTVDTIAPTVTITSAVANPINGVFSVTITFDESIDNFIVGDITVTNATLSGFTETVSKSVWTVNVTPTGAAVSVQVEADKSMDSALNGNNASISLSRTYDGTAPQITNITSSNTSATYGKDQTIDITVQFSEIVTVSGGTPTLTLNSGGTAYYLSGSSTDTLTFGYVVGAVETALDLDVQTFNLNGATIKDAALNEAVLTLPALANLANNKNIGIETTAPTVNSYTPADGLIDVLVGTNLVINFSEPVNAVTGKTIRIYKTVGNTLSQTISTDNATYVSGGGTSTITINPPTDLAFGTEYYIQIDAGAFTDAAGNSYAGIADNTTWNFTTKPAGNINVMINITSPTNYTVTFSPNVNNINKNLGETLFVSAVLDGAEAYQWYLDGVPYATTSSISISSLSLNLGVHNLAVVVTKLGQQYSAQTNFSVVSY